MSTLKVEVLKIDDILPHGNADKLELAIIKGWQCVSTKNTYNKGDLIIYVPIDSILPNNLEKLIFPPDSKIKLSNSRIRTIKIRGAISQGLIINPILLINNNLISEKDIKENNDLTAKLNIKKYEPIEEDQRALLGNLHASKKEVKDSSFIKYTNIENYKNYNNLFTEEDFVVVTEKLHGTNSRFMVTKPQTFLGKILGMFSKKYLYRFYFGSRNVNMMKNKKCYFKDNVYLNIAIKYNLQEKLKEYPNYIFYGEIIGDGIQKNYNYGCKKGEQRLVFFDIYDTKNKKYLDYNEFCVIIDSLKLDRVPQLYIGKFNFDLIKLKMIENGGNSFYCTDQRIIEGVVIKTYKEEKCFINRKMLKLINDEYLLQKNNSDLH